MKAMAEPRSTRVCARCCAGWVKARGRRPRADAFSSRGKGTHLASSVGFHILPPAEFRKLAPTKAHASRMPSSTAAVENGTPDITGAAALRDALPEFG